MQSQASARFPSPGIVCLLAALLSGCGGGGGSGSDSGSAVISPTNTTLVLKVQLQAQGTVVTCDANEPVQARLSRVADGRTTFRNVDCPSQQVLAGDFALSQWQLVPLSAVGQSDAATETVEASTVLPPPIVLSDGDKMVVVRDSALEMSGGEVQLERESGGVAHTEALSVDDEFNLPASVNLAEAQWRWSINLNGEVFNSPKVPARTFTDEDTGQWGALAVSDPTQSDRTALVGLSDFDTLGLSQFTTARTFRDIRYVDLDGDGLQDIVSDVYGSGCVLIAMAGADGSYSVETPKLDDGSCIGGHGETILVADFDGDGLVDIFIPTYERFYYLHNLGGGHFEEIAASLGISFPEYQPHAEGAAAVDIDQNGTVDIVVGSEILLNDGNGHFTQVDHPFGPARIFDEGMSIADVDGDGRFDIVKNDPALGPRIFWGTATPAVFDDAGWMFGGAAVSTDAFGLAVGNLTGSPLADIVFAGGNITGANVEGNQSSQQSPGSSPPPRVCVQSSARQFKCLGSMFPTNAGAWQDLVMITDVNSDGVNDLVGRYGTVHVYAGSKTDRNIFRFDLRDANGARTLFGRAVRELCATDNSVIALTSVDGGNGYMAQGSYVISVQSEWCSSVALELPDARGTTRLGPFGPGFHTVQLN